MLTAEARNVCWPRFVRLYPELRKFECPIIKLNNRFTKTAGQCLVEHNLVQIAAKFLPKHHHEIFSVTLPHEIAHQIDVNLNGMPRNNRWHGVSWQKIMVQYGLTPDTYHTMEI